MFRFYDQASKIRYDFRNDDSVLYVILETDNRISQARILRKGVKIFLSPNSKIDESRFILYPTSFNEPNRPSRDRNNENSDEQKERMKAMRERMIANIGKVALWNDNANQQSFAVGNDNFGFDYYIDFDPQGFLHYEARISLRRLAMNHLDKSSVIGIRIPEMEMPQGGGGEGANRGGGGRMSGGMNMGGGGMRMGGMGGWGMRMGGGGGGMHSGGNYRQNAESANEKINWWYQLKIN